jgi:hypothetical protein
MTRDTLSQIVSTPVPRPLFDAVYIFSPERPIGIARSSNIYHRRGSVDAFRIIAEGLVA